MLALAASDGAIMMLIVGLALLIIVGLASSKR
jgi:hypothetical protein